MILKLVSLFIVAVMLVAACVPDSSTTPSTTTTAPQATTTVVTTTAATTTTTAPSGNVLLPSGSDDTARLVAAVQQNTVVYIDGPLKIDNIAAFGAISGRTITFRGGGKLVRSTLVNPSGDNVTFPVMQFQGSSSITLNNPVIVGPASGCTYNSTREEQTALRLNGVSNFTVNGGSLTNMPGDGITIFYNWLTNPSTPSTSVTINNVSINCVGRSAISNVYSSNVTVNGGNYNNAGRWILNIEPFNTTYVHDYRVNNPTIGKPTFAWIYVGYPSSTWTCNVQRVVIYKPVFTTAVYSSIAGCADVSVIP